MKKLKRFLSVLLCAAMVAGLMVTTSFAATADKTSVSGEGNGLNITKYVTDNKDGSYNLTMEAYATGTVSTTTKSTPADIILVLDQSGSMASTYTSVTSAQYNKISYSNNARLGLTRDLFIKLNNGEYARVEVNWILGYYSYTWTDENGNEQQTGSYGSLLDCPNSIQGKLYQLKTSSTDVSRLQALKDSATNFINAVQQDADINKVDHRIAVVGFASSGTNYNDSKWENTELLSTQDVVSYNGVKAANYSDALVSANSNGAVNTRLTTAVNRLDANGGTWINYGLEMAQGILNNTDGTGRNRIVVVLTDGTPGNGTWGNTVTGNTCASEALSKASALKNAGVTVYTVGIFDGADATSAGANSGTTAQKSNYFMQKMSSNNGTVSDPGYYLSADNQTALQNIFQQIANEAISSASAADETSVLTDTLASNFNFKLNNDGSVSGVSVKTAARTGDNSWSDPVDAADVAFEKKDGDTISFSGFDFSDEKNVVVKTKDGSWQGNKLIVTFTIVPDATATWKAGENYYPTNDTENNKAGIYAEDGTALLVLNESPEVPVTAYTVTFNAGNNGKIAEDKTSVSGIYLSGAAYPTAPATSPDEDYAFDGWVDDADNKVDTFPATVTANAIYTASWKQVSTNPSVIEPKAAVYKIEHYQEQLDGNYTLVEDDTDSLVGNLNTTVNATAKTYDHYTLNETKSVKSGTVVMPEVKDGKLNVLTLKMYYDLDTFTVTFNAGEHGKIGNNQDSVSDTYKYGADYPTAPAITPGEHFVFDGWLNADGAKVGTFPETVTANATYTASWKQVSTDPSVIEPKAAVYKVEHYQEQLNGSYTLVEDDTEFPLFGEIGATVSATAKDYEHYTLNDTMSVKSGIVVMPTVADGANEPTVLTLKMYYDLDTFTVTYVVDGDSPSTSDLPGVATYKYGETVTVADDLTTDVTTDANGDNGTWTFDGWDQDGEITVSGDVVITGKWTFNKDIDIVTGDTPEKGDQPGDQPGTQPGTQPETKPEQTADPTTPATGDNSNMLLWICVMMASGCAVVGTMVYNKKKHNAK